ncbi:MAG: hypothetical protein P1U87_16955 [Verrucomicrobiales bacterium]|nr:hypothetical protein [Verrucomicrobiales bacterium]
MEQIPITILAGSDHAPGHLPKTETELHSLSTAYKGAEVKVGGRPLIELLVERIEQSAGFGPVTIAGPAGIYEPLGLKAEIVDTNGGIAVNMKAAFEHHQQRHGKKPMAILAYDVLLEAGEFDEIRNLYEEDAPCAIWIPFVRKPEEEEELGAFGWKPTYALLPAKGEPPIPILPGHIGIVRLEEMRLSILYQLFDLAYKTRNHSVKTRKRVMVRSVFGKLLLYDLRALCSLRAPRLTLSVIANGVRIADRLRKGDLLISELEQAIAGIFLRHDSELNVAGRGVRHPIVDILSLGEDIDTEEEAAGLEL